MSIVTLNEAKSNLGITVTTYDTQLQTFVDAADRVIEDITGPVLAASVTETFNGGRQSVVLRSPAASVTSVTVDGTALAAGDFTADLASGVVYSGSTTVPTTFSYGRQNIVVEYTVGADTVDANVKLAALELIRFWWQVGHQGNRPGFDQQASFGYDQTVTPSGFAVPRRVIELCGPNMRRPGIA